MLEKPACRQPRNFFKLAWLFEEMGRPGDDFESFLSAKFCEGFAVPPEHLTIGFSDDEERRCDNFRQHSGGHVGPAAAADDPPDRLRSLHRCHQRSSSSRARPEVSQPDTAHVALRQQPVGRSQQPLGEKRDVKTQASRAQIDRFLLLCEQVEEQRAQTGTVQHSGNKLVAWTQPAAAASMREKHYTVRLDRHRQITVEHYLSGREANFDRLHGTYKNKATDFADSPQMNSGNQWALLRVIELSAVRASSDLSLDDHCPTLAKFPRFTAEAHLVLLWRNL
jgi:hypothetical protein